MTTRREFAQIAALGTGLAAAPVWARQSGQSGKLDYFLLEQDALAHSPIALESAGLGGLAQGFREIARRFREIREIKGADLSQFWFEVQPSLSRGSIALAGLTTGYSAFVIAQLMQDYGYGLVSARRAASASKTLVPSRDVLPSVELNTAPAVYWAMAKSGTAFR